MIKKKKIDLKIQISDELLGKKILCDWKLYKLILFNIIQNAVKYNKNEGKILIINRII